MGLSCADTHKRMQLGLGEYPPTPPKHCFPTPCEEPSPTESLLAQRMLNKLRSPWWWNSMQTCHICVWDVNAARRLKPFPTAAENECNVLYIGTHASITTSMRSNMAGLGKLVLVICNAHGKAYTHISQEDCLQGKLFIVISFFIQKRNMMLYP